MLARRDPADIEPHIRTTVVVEDTGQNLRWSHRLSLLPFHAAEHPHARRPEWGMVP